MAKPAVTVLRPRSHTWISTSSCVTPVPQHLGPAQPCRGHRPHLWDQASLQLPRLVSSDHPEASWVPKTGFTGKEEVASLEPLISFPGKNLLEFTIRHLSVASS